MDLKSTAIYENRLSDKKDLEEKLGLEEFGNSKTKFYSTNDVLLFEGYERVVYGDHGPYIEFSLQNIRCKLISKFNNNVDFNNLPGDDFKYYYYWLVPVCAPNIKVYLQIKNSPQFAKRSQERRWKAILF